MISWGVRNSWTPSSHHLLDPFPKLVTPLGSPCIADQRDTHFKGLLNMGTLTRAGHQPSKVTEIKHQILQIDV